MVTLLHISDLHFGDLTPAGDSAILPGLIHRWRAGREYYGWFGHTRAAAEQLAEFWKRLRSEEDARLVVTGDLTAWGSASQFRLALDYIRGRADLGGGGPVGLECPDALVIPGNHDHWPGPRVLGRPTRAFRDAFPAMPWVKRFPGLTIAGIDSDADVWSWSPARAYGRGAFRSQLRKLETMLDAPRDGEARVLLCHHSPTRAKYCLAIQPSSARALDAFLARHGFGLLLTGHVHAPHVGMRNGVLEARAPSALVRDRLPEEWVAAGGGAVYDLPPNGVMVHRLGPGGWQVESFSRNGDGIAAPRRPVKLLEADRLPGGVPVTADVSRSECDEAAASDVLRAGARP